MFPAPRSQGGNQEQSAQNAAAYRDHSVALSAPQMGHLAPIPNVTSKRNNIVHIRMTQALYILARAWWLACHQNRGQGTYRFAESTEPKARRMSAPQ
jgi:hypothetical protein